MAKAARREPDTSGWSTRELILLHASRLFAARGFLGTSTRDIAHAVGIRQPSVYSHFPSKQAIAEELLTRDLVGGSEALERFARDGGGPPVELYRYLLWEVTHDLESPFDLRSLYLGEMLDLPEFAETRRLLRRYDALVKSVIVRGMATGDFHDVDARFAQRAVDALILQAMRGYTWRVSPLPDEPDQTASFVLRSLLARPSRLSAVRTAAHRAGI
jgi:AcrR family transcriptional regulator